MDCTAVRGLCARSCSRLLDSSRRTPANDYAPESAAEETCGSLGRSGECRQEQRRTCRELFPAGKLDKIVHVHVSVQVQYV